MSFGRTAMAKALGEEKSSAPCSYDDEDFSFAQALIPPLCSIKMTFFYDISL